jgi:RimJ/RimL family protein N-acetyltransferase
VVDQWPNQQPTLRGDAVLLRPWAAADAGEVYQACQDPEIQRYTTVPVPYLPEHAETFVGSFQRSHWMARTGVGFAVADAGTEQLLGACGLVGLDWPASWSGVGYWVAPWGRRRGVATCALRLLAQWALLELGLREIVAEVEDTNPASLRVAQAAGFRPAEKPSRWEEHRGEPRLFLTLVRRREVQVPSGTSTTRAY